MVRKGHVLSYEARPLLEADDVRPAGEDELRPWAAELRAGLLDHLKLVPEELEAQELHRHHCQWYDDFAKKVKLNSKRCAPNGIEETVAIQD